MKNVVKNIYISGNADTILALLTKQLEPLTTNLAIELPLDASRLKDLYKALATDHQRKFIFLLNGQEIPKEIVEDVCRFFFLSNYHTKDTAPLFVYKGDEMPQNTRILQWCKAQGLNEPEFLSTQDFTSETANSNAFIYVGAAEEKNFLPIYLNKIVKFEWLPRKIIFNAANEQQAQTLILELHNFIKTLIQQNAGIYEALTTLTQLEDSLRRSETVVKFLEMEINNQKLYNKLMRGEEAQPPTVVTYTSYDQMVADLTSFKNDRHRLLNEIGKLRSDLAWYKRTFEERSFMGLIKEKLFRKIRHR